MFLWQILEMALTVTLGLIVFTQIVLPPFIGKRFFWLFRRKEREIREAESELLGLKAELEAQDIRGKKAELEKSRKPRKTRDGQKVLTSHKEKEEE